MNKVILMGRLTKDAELRQTQSGISIARFTIAVNRRFASEGQPKADFINCIAWRQTGEFIHRYFRKGSMIAVIGSMQTRSWDGTDGRRQYATEVNVDEAYFTGSKAESEAYSQAPAARNSSQAPAQNYSQSYTQMHMLDSNNFGDDFDDFTDIDGSEEDLPF